MSFKIIRQDITKVVADAIVNTANPDVGIGGGVDSAIYEAAGEEQLLAARAKIGYLNPGEVAITPGFNSRAKYIIHSSGPWFEGGNRGEADILRQCYDKSLQLAVDNGCKSIAFPLMATGTYGFPKELGMEIATAAFGDFLEEHDIDITLVVFGSEAVRLSGRLFDEVREYVTDETVEDTLDREYAIDYENLDIYRSTSRALEFDDSKSELRPVELHSNSVPAPTTPPISSIKPRKKSGSNLLERFERILTGTPKEESTPDSTRDLPLPEPTRRIGSSAELYESEADTGIETANVAYSASEDILESSICMKEPCVADTFDASMSIEDFVTGDNLSLAEHIRQLINKKHMTNSQVYTRANIKKQYFSKIMKGESFPSKQKLLCIAIALRLNMDETRDLLLWGGYAISPHITEDKIFAWFIMHEKYDIIEIDYVRFDFNLPSLYE